MHINIFVLRIHVVARSLQQAKFNDMKIVVYTTLIFISTMFTTSLLNSVVNLYEINKSVLKNQA